MSATGHGGVTLIAGRNYGEVSPVSIPAYSDLTFTHNLGRRAYQVIVTSGAPINFGAVLTSAQSIDVAQPTANAIVVSNNEESPVLVFIACRWEENTAELDLVLAGEGTAADDPRISIESRPG